MVKIISKFVGSIIRSISWRIYLEAYMMRWRDEAYADHPFSQKVLKKVFRLYLIAAKLGGDDAQCAVALMYLHGDGVSQDNDSFLYWITRALEQRSSTAVFHLADFHRNTPKRLHYSEDGKCIRSIDLAYNGYEILAKLGIAEAQEILGDMYRIGEGDREPDREKALYWYGLAAENGVCEAEEMLEFMKGYQDRNSN